MSIERGRGLIARMAELRVQINVIGEISNNRKVDFAEQAKDFTRATAGMKKRMLGDLNRCWLEGRAAMRLHVILMSEYEKVQRELSELLVIIAQQNGERLPPDYELPKQTKFGL